LKQDYAEAGSNLLLCLNYDKRCSNAELYQAHRAWGQPNAETQHSASNIGSISSLRLATKLRRRYSPAA
jgi:hypothetical protein